MWAGIGRPRYRMEPQRSTELPRSTQLRAGDATEIPMSIGRIHRGLGLEADPILHLRTTPPSTEAPQQSFLTPELKEVAVPHTTCISPAATWQKQGGNASRKMGGHSVCAWPRSEGRSEHAPSPEWRWRPVRMRWRHDGACARASWMDAAGFPGRSSPGCAPQPRRPMARVRGMRGSQPAGDPCSEDGADLHLASLSTGWLPLQLQDGTTRRERMAVPDPSGPYHRLTSIGTSGRGTKTGGARVGRLLLDSRLMLSGETNAHSKTRPRETPPP